MCLPHYIKSVHLLFCTACQATLLCQKNGVYGCVLHTKMPRMKGSSTPLPSSLSVSKLQCQVAWKMPDCFHQQIKTMCTGNSCGSLLLIWFLPTQNSAQTGCLGRRSPIVSVHLQTEVLSKSFPSTSQVSEVALCHESGFISVMGLQSGCISP